MFSGIGGGSDAGRGQAGDDDTVQREAAGGAAPDAAVETAGPVDGGSGSTTPAPGAPPATSAAHLDEMARRLYEPLAARLREELWLDRERAGLLSDL